MRNTAIAPAATSAASGIHGAFTYLLMPAPKPGSSPPNEPEWDDFAQRLARDRPHSAIVGGRSFICG